MWARKKTEFNLGTKQCPKFVLFMIFEHSDSPQTLANCKAVCKRWRKTIEEQERLWKNLLMRRGFGEEWLEELKKVFKSNWENICFTIYNFASLRGVCTQINNVLTFKSVLIGESGVGKTSLMRVRICQSFLLFVSVVETI